MMKEIISTFKEMSTYEILTLVSSVIGIGVGVWIGVTQISIMKSLNPDLHGEILQTVDGAISGTNDTGLMISASIVNLGSATIVKNYSIEIVLAGETIVRTYIPKVIPKIMMDQNPTTFGTGDAAALYDRTVHVIGTGDQAVGWLFFPLSNVKPEQLHAAGTRMTLVYYDIKGKRYESEERIFTGNNDGTLNYLPGAGTPLTKPQ